MDNNANNTIEINLVNIIIFEILGVLIFYEL